MKIRPTLRIDVRDRRHLLTSFFHHGRAAGMFVPDHLRFEVGTELALEIVVRQPQTSFNLRGKVQWKRHATAGRLPAGIGVVFAPEDIATQDLLLEFAEGREVQLRERRAKRYPVMIDVQYRSRASFLSDLTGDLSLHGAFIATRETFTPGTRVDLKLKPPGSLFAIHIKGIVRWCQRDDRLGIGVEFQFLSERTRRRLQKLVESVESQMQAELGLGER